MKKFVVIVAGGSGNRMGSEIPKQFLLLDGKPILMHTIRVFYEFDPGSEIIVVLPADQQEYWKNLCHTHQFKLEHQVVKGGESRFHSVQNGLAQIGASGVVFIHDGVRPLVSSETLNRCLKTAQELGNAIPVLPVTESLRKTDGDTSISVDRSLFFSVQTPQTFRCEQILEAFGQDYDPAFTDDASVAEKAGFSIYLVDGNRENIKITTPVDMVVAEALISQQIQ